MTTFHVLNVNANCNILEIGLTYLLAVIMEAIFKSATAEKSGYNIQVINGTKIFIVYHTVKALST